ncbi:MAG: hypothetical protein AB7V50_03790 [Vampirovibrionia bacterium]
MEISLNNNKSIFRILKESCFLYFNNFLPYSKAMIFPVLAHLIGIPYIIIVAYTLPDFLVAKFNINSFFLLFLLGLVAVLPGFLLFLKGFWAYLVAMVSLNSFTKALVEGDSDTDLKKCTKKVAAIKGKYVNVLLLMMLLWIAGLIIAYAPAVLIVALPWWLVIILMLISGLVSFLLLIALSVFFSLSFQVLAFEDFSTFSVFKRSMFLVEKNFFRTLFLIVLLYIITGIIAPLVIHSFFNIVGITGLIVANINWMSQLFVDQVSLSALYYPDSILGYINSLLILLKNPAAEISNTVVSTTIDATVTAGMLPLGSIAFSLLYFDIINKKQ